MLNGQHRHRIRDGQAAAHLLPVTRSALLARRSAFSISSLRTAMTRRANERNRLIDSFGGGGAPLSGAAPLPASPSGCCGLAMPGQILVGDALSSDTRDHLAEAAAVVRLALVEPERLLNDVAIKMERLDAHIGAL